MMDDEGHVVVEDCLCTERAVQSAWHLQLIDRAVADVHAFLKALAKGRHDAWATCWYPVRIAGPAGPSSRMHDPPVSPDDPLVPTGI